MDPGEHVFYVGGRDGKIYISALNAECNRNSIHGMFIIGALYDHSKAITCLAFSTDGVTLVSRTEDGIVRVWDTKTKHVTRVLKHAKGPINNVLIVRQPLLRNPISVNRKHLNLSLPPPLSKYVDSTDAEVKTNAIVLLQSPCHDPEEIRFCSSYVMERQIKELQKQNTSGAAEMEMERLRLECKRKTQLVQQWKKLYQDMQSLCVNELMDGTQGLHYATALMDRVRDTGRVIGGLISRNAELHRQVEEVRAGAGPEAVAAVEKRAAESEAEAACLRSELETSKKLNEELQKTIRVERIELRLSRTEAGTLSKKLVEAKAEARAASEALAEEVRL
ncbi:unnamed protein product [Musa hybrid cultivar]